MTTAVVITPHNLQNPARKWRPMPNCLGIRQSRGCETWPHYVKTPYLLVIRRFPAGPLRPAIRAFLLPCQLGTGRTGVPPVGTQLLQLGEFRTLPG